MKKVSRGASSACVVRVLSTFDVGGGGEAAATADDAFEGGRQRRQKEPPPSPLSPTDVSSQSPLPPSLSLSPPPLLAKPHHRDPVAPLRDTPVLRHSSTCLSGHRRRCRRLPSALRWLRREVQRRRGGRRGGGGGSEASLAAVSGCDGG